MRAGAVPAPAAGRGPRSRTGRRAAARVLAAGLSGAALAVLPAAPAQASEYRYWSFWEQRDGSWAYATQGPSVHRVADGDVYGFRFAVSENSGDAAMPRGPAAFATLCADTPAKPGTHRVALVLDFGTDDDAPPGERPPNARTECTRVEEGDTVGDALAATAKPLRYNSDALLCAIADYPRSGCGEELSGDRAAGDGRDTRADGGENQGDGGSGGDGLPTGLGVAAGVGTVAVLGAAALRQSRRRRG